MKKRPRFRKLTDDEIRRAAVRLALLTKQRPRETQLTEWIERARRNEGLARIMRMTITV